MTAEERIVRRLRRAGDGIMGELDKLEAEIRAKVKRETDRIARVGAPGRSPEEKRSAHRASTGTIREQVFARSGGKCEVSGIDLGEAWELHHLRGAGARRSHQALATGLAVSWEVHRLIHRGDLGTLRAVKEACIRLGMRDGLAAIGRRIEKVEEARRTPSVPVRIEVAS